ncbi:MAG: hypothetical protein IPJ06_01820 [Saprospiraceae bacterium]|nr:hypothetical protein [Saprospiraceae bacterium]
MAIQNFRIYAPPERRFTSLRWSVHRTVVNNPVLFVGISIYLILITFSLVYYLERTVFMDIAFHLFSLVTTETFAIQNFRFGAFITQAALLVGIDMGLSLHSLLIIYSTIFPILSLTLFILIVRVFQQPKMGIVLLLSQIAMVNDTFYWVQSELQQGIQFLILYFSILCYHKNNPSAEYHIWWRSIHPAFLFMLVFFHPLLLFPFIFLCVYFLITKTLSKSTVLSSGSAFFSMVIIKFYFFKTAYDSKSMEGVAQWKESIATLFSNTTMHSFYQDLVTDYFLLLLGMIWLVVHGFRQKSLFTPVLVIGAFIGYSVLVQISYPDNPVKFYSENLYLPLAIMVMTPLLFEHWKWPAGALTKTGLFLIVTLRLFQIQQAHIPYSDRLDWMRSFLRDHPGQKLIVDDHSLPLDTLLMTWATPYEFWLLSTIETGQTASIMLTDQPREVEWAIGMPDHFIAKWGVFPYKDLPARYFHFSDQGPYLVIRSSEKDE